VQAAIQQWLTSQRGFLIDAWENYQYMRYLMAPEYERSGLPRRCCSASWPRNPVARCTRSRAPAPADRCSSCPRPVPLRPVPRYQRFRLALRPQLSARANAAYINERFAELNRNLEFTIAAYNGGEGRAARLYSANGGASFWSPQVMAQMPPETRDYVPAVIAAAWLFLHPKKYGLDSEDRHHARPVHRRAHTSINELTICLGNGGTRDGYFRVLRNLNPRYEASQAIAQGTVMRAPRARGRAVQRNCIQGPRATLAQNWPRQPRLDAGREHGAAVMSTSQTVADAMSQGDRPSGAPAIGQEKEAHRPACTACARATA
jgi:membrane-bound lytic murein transglycosylase D